MKPTHHLRWVVYGDDDVMTLEQLWIDEADGRITEWRGVPVYEIQEGRMAS